MRLFDEGLLAEPLQFSIVLGVRGGMAATPDNLLMMVRRLPPNCIWQIIAIGKANLQLTAMALALGGNARAGLEDCLYLRKGVHARNLGLVTRAVAAAQVLELPLADVKATEERLRLPGRAASAAA